MRNADNDLNTLAETARQVAKPVILVVMGVSSSGKSTVAKFLSDALGCPFQEGDELHPKANVDKMRGGAPLTDEDRIPWLDRIASMIDGWRACGESGVLTCSALKRAYRAKIIGDRHDVTLVYLNGSYELIKQRMAARRNHYMPVSLLDSQFATLEPPGPEEHPITVDIAGNGAAIACEVARDLVDRQRREPKPQRTS
jgi:carbohydrate kinase (thermoresistant glucokinase family)